MKTSRRKFIGLGAAALSAFPFVKSWGKAKSNLVAKPIVVSTWNFGIEANKEAWKVLSANGRSLDAIEKGVQVPEGDPTENTVGLGGLPDREGKVTLDACIMDEKANCGAVVCLEHIVHPISVARKVMEDTPHVMLVGDGALQFALEKGFKKEKLLTKESEKAWKEWLKTSKYKPIANIENHDTIGMVAMDINANISGGCTTSGMAYKMRGRVGDSPIIGAGLFVDNEIGAATSTGVGEEVIRIVGSHLVVELMRQGNSPQAACEMAVKRIVKNQPENSKQIQVGFLAINKSGEYGAYALQKGFTYAVYSPDIPNKLFDAKSYY
ncbi:MAG: N(4)-(beta-N-acetylglucosaminyl)-L-asparaginase [Cyclobacteriaceae bacterium]|nr:N(4)-(beta-N-acetylglucosaminyl)-L-asparaginase [Cyclobacteriaceae bacterium]